MSFTPSNLKQIRKDIDAALEKVAEEHGLTFDLGNIRYSSDNFRVTLKANKPEVNETELLEGEVPDDGEVNWVKVVGGNVLPSNLKDRKFRAGNNVYTLVGVKSGRWKYPFIGEGPQGGRYKFGLNTVKNGLI